MSEKLKIFNRDGSVTEVEPLKAWNPGDFFESARKKKMQMITTGNVTLPDGCEVHAVEKWIYEPETNGGDQVSLEIEWPDGKPLEAEEYNELIMPGYFLHEYVSEQLAKTGKTEEDYYDPF